MRVSQQETASNRQATRLFAYNCAPCKRKKVRCNRVRPCSNCTLHDCETECYPTLDSISIPNEDTSPPIVNQEENGSRNKRGRHTDALLNLRRGQATSSTSSSGSPYLPEKSSTASKFSTTLDGNSITSASSAWSHNDGAQSESLQAKMALALPNLPLCFALLDFADTVLGETSFLDLSTLRQIASDIIAANETFSTRQACLLFWTLSFASQNVPPNHRLADTYIQLDKSTEHWRKLALQISSTIQSGNDDAADLLIDVSIAVLQSVWHSRYGEIRQSWIATGTGIRKGAFIHLFDTPLKHTEFGNFDLRNLPDTEIRAFLMGSKLLLMDRWVAFNNRYPLGISRDDLNAAGGPFAFQKTNNTSIVKIQSLAESHSLRVCLEQKQVILLELGRELRRKCQYATQDESSREDCRNFAHEFLAQVDAQRQAGSRLILPSNAAEMTMTPSHDLLLLPIEQAFQIAEWRGACAYIACVAMTVFVKELGASTLLRQASFYHACETLKLAQVFTRAIQLGTIPISLTRLSNQLFCAFRAIIVTKVSEDPLGSEDATLLGNDNGTADIDDGVGGSGASPGRLETLSATASDAAPLDVNQVADDDTAAASTSLSSLIQDGITCIEAMKQQGSPIAERVLHLVIGTIQRHDIFKRGGAEPLNDSFSTAQGVVHIDGAHQQSDLSDKNRYWSSDDSTLQEPSFGDSTNSFDKLLEAFLGCPSYGVDPYLQQEQMDAILTSFLQDVPYNK